jgi:RNA polymerase sigma-70 factor (ECF subfamily)
MDGPSDEDLMARIAGGDERAFRLLVQRYIPRALGLARRVLGNEADAEEIVQEAMLRVWINAARWRPTAAFRTWLYRVVLNLCLNRKRRAPFTALVDIVEPADPAPGPHLELEMRETDRLLAAAIAALPARQSAAIVLTYQEAMSNAEAAAVLGTSVSGIETLLVRAKRALRKALGPAGQQ